MAEPRDELDHKILDLHDKKLSNLQMEKELGVHRNTIHARLRRMERKPHQMRQSQTTRAEQYTLGEPAASRFPVEELDIDRIRQDVATQMRLELSIPIIIEYAEAMREGEVFPPITVFREQADEPYWLADGWHRLEAVKKLGRERIAAEIRPGDLDAAIDQACQANSSHGLRPSIEDRRKAVRTQLERHPERSDREIARLVRCSATTVGTYRGELQDERRASSRRVQMDTLPNPPPAPAEPEPSPVPANPAPLDRHDTPQAHLEAEQVMDLDPIARRRELSPGELEEATRSLAEGEDFSALCQRLRVTPATLRQQVLQMLWHHWTAAHGLQQSRCPQALDF